MLQRLQVALAPVIAGNTSENNLNKIKNIFFLSSKCNYWKIR